MTLTNKDHYDLREFDDVQNIKDEMAVTASTRGGENAIDLIASGGEICHRNLLVRIGGPNQTLCLPSCSICDTCAIRLGAKGDARGRQLGIYRN